MYRSVLTFCVRRKGWVLGLVAWMVGVPLWLLPDEVGTRRGLVEKGRITGAIESRQEYQQWLADRDSLAAPGTLGSRVLVSEREEGSGSAWDSSTMEGRGSTTRCGATRYWVRSSRCSLAQPASPQDAVTRAAFQRLRPIFITTLTTIADFLPLLLQGDRGDIWYTLALGTSGGLISSSVLVVLVVPLCLIWRGSLGARSDAV